MVHYILRPDHTTYACTLPVPHTGPNPGETDPTQTGCWQCRRSFGWLMAIEDTAVLIAITQGADTARLISQATTLTVGEATLTLHRLQLTGRISSDHTGRATIIEKEVTPDALV